MQDKISEAITNEVEL